MYIFTNAHAMVQARKSNHEQEAFSEWRYYQRCCNSNEHSKI